MGRTVEEAIELRKITKPFLFEVALNSDSHNFYIVQIPLQDVASS